MRVVTGYHAIEESLRAGGAKGELLISVKSGRIRRIVDAARAAGVKVRFTEKKELDGLTGDIDHRGAVYLPRDSGEPRFLDFDTAVRALDAESALVVILDQITDPQNLGAILRSADLFAVDLVVIPSKRSAHVNETVSKISAGASSYVPMAVATNLTRALKNLKDSGFWIYGAAMDGEAIYHLNLSGRVALVMGSEGHGLGRLVRETCDGFVMIPTSGHIDSLNVSVAAGICLYEIRRQQATAG